MRECWLKTNRRATVAAFALPVVLILLAVFFVAIGFREDHTAWTIGTGAAFAAVAVIIMIPIVIAARLPRLAYEDGFLLVYLRGRSPIKVPIEIVEVFFLGQGPAMIKAKGGEAETTTIVIRLAESATAWHHRDVRAMLGQWVDGYIVIRGTWCEKIDAELMQGLNRRLVEVHRLRRQVADHQD